MTLVRAYVFRHMDKANLVAEGFSLGSFFVDEEDGSENSPASFNNHYQIVLQFVNQHLPRVANSADTHFHVQIPYE